MDVKSNSTLHNNASDDEIWQSNGTSPTELLLAVGLFVIMVGVGASCKVELLRKLIRSPKALKAAAVGVLCQFVFMPVVAYILTLIFKLEGYTALGVVLAGSMPGGSSSNVFTLWSHGILELSVAMTMLSTIVAFGATQFWLYIWIHFALDGVREETIPFARLALIFGLLAIPLSIGVSLNFLSCLDKVRRHVERGLNVIAVIIFVAAIVSISTEYSYALRHYLNWKIFLAAGICFPIATGLSYVLTTFLGLPPAVRRTVVMEVGLQNLPLAFAIGEASHSTIRERDEALPFPLMYAMFMYAWGALLIPLMRRQKRLNGDADCDADFFLPDKTPQNDGNEVEEGGDVDVESVAIGKRESTEELENTYPTNDDDDAANEKDDGTANDIIDAL